MDTYLPPKYSLNSFFVRHVAHPKRMKYISGLHNHKICSVNDVGYFNLDSNKEKESQTFPPNNHNENMLKSERRKERAVPPNGIWQTYGLIDNTDKWRSELNSLASSVGLLTQTDIEDLKRKKERDEMIKSLNKKPKNPMSQRSNLASQSLKTPATSKSQRLNEPLLTGRRTSRFSRGGSKGISTGNKYIVNQADREAWMLQVLCQILQTDSLVDVQAWLVSTSDQEKERVKVLIDQAMKGLQESGRIESSSNDQPISIENNQSTLDDIENTLKRIDLNKMGRQEDGPRNTYSSSSNYNSKTKLPHISSDNDDFRKKLDSIPEVLKLDENATFKLETPVNNSKDYKIEQVKVSLLVKDENSNETQELNGNWEPNEH
jgi:hypothetical protein